MSMRLVNRKNLDHQSRVFLWTLNFYIQLHAFLKSPQIQFSKNQQMTFQIILTAKVRILVYNTNFCPFIQTRSPTGILFPSVSLTLHAESNIKYQALCICICVWYNIQCLYILQSVIFNTTISLFSIFLSHLLAFLASFPFPVLSPNSNLNNLWKESFPFLCSFSFPSFNSTWNSMPKF